MKRFKHNFKKGMAFVLSLAMVAGLVPAMSGGANTVQAATGSGTEPSVTAYATKDQLMNAFKPNSDGTATTTGKLVFGHNSSSNAQEWYILGKDTGVTGDNTIIFAASPIATNQKFNSDTSDKTYDSTTVNADHYGASDLRVALKDMADGSDTAYFTSAEQGLMNATTVTTNDTKNGGTYTTTDKLYALAADGYGSTTIKAGTNNQTVLAMSKYWSRGTWFWLRSPYGYRGCNVLHAYPGDSVDGDIVNGVYAVQPASNLNLSYVLFASAATAVSSDTVESDTIAPEAAMTLRLNGTGKNIGTVTYNTTTGDIKATKGSTSKTVALVVQGKGTVNGEEKDWYYSKKITGPETVNALDIKSALSLSSDIDLSECKIWLEITDTNGLIYAVGAEKEIEKINTTYVTKEQLMNSFKPGDDGTATTKGKLVFGKNSSGEAQEWYILGKDTGVTGDNTIIFAASPIATNQKFNSTVDNKTYNYEAGTGYGDSAGSKEVYASHYGASDLRAALQRMLEDESGNAVETCFSEAEQGLMNATTVTTKDTKNSATYTTTDKLYALAADGSGSSYKTIKAGTSDSTVLAMDSYWSSGAGFWLRSPHDDYASSALLAFTGGFVFDYSVYYGIAVQPASNLDLSSVLFASSAKAASSDTVESGIIADGTAMTLRLNGTGKNIGTVTYNATTGDIKATKGSTSQTVALIVQGKGTVNGEEKDWYYSKQITGTEVVNINDIVSETNTPASIDLSACKIWLETTDSTENLTYAVEATETTIIIIHSVAITDIETPVSNTALDTEASCVTTGVSSAKPQITWTPNDSTAGYNKSYTASITLTADTSYEFTDSTTATVLSNSATSVTKNADGTLTVTYDFSATAKDKLTSITAPKAITVANGTAYSAMNLPATVNIETEGNTVSSASVTWNTTTPENGSYDPSVLTEQTVTLNGTVACPASIDDNGVELTTTITITISAAGIVGAPTANPTAGIYTENQSVTLTSSTEGATIYYTTDGSEPTITGGVPGGTTAEYTAPIAVTGTEGQSVTTTIKAIAVKNDMLDSSVETFTYTIQIPVPKYTVTVTNGSGTGQYAQGETVTITAGAAPSGQQFKEWEVVSGTITLASSTSETTTFTMPAEAVSVKATYKAKHTTHSYDDGKVTKPATFTQTGQRTYTCTECGATKTNEIAMIKSVALSQTSYTYDGKVKKPTVTVKDSAGKVITATNYTLTYQTGSTLPGSYTVKITFKGNYSGTKSLSYKIVMPVTTLNKVTNVAGGVTISYNKLAVADGYYIYRKDTQAGSWHYIGATTNATYTDKTASNGVVHYYAVKAYKKNPVAGGQAFISQSSNAKNTIYVKNIFVSSLTNPTAGTMLVKYSSNTIATGYEIAYSPYSTMGPASTKTIKVVGAKNLSKTVTGLTKGKVYYVKVRAYKTVAGYTFYSSWSAIKNVKISV